MRKTITLSRKSSALLALFTPLAILSAAFIISSTDAFKQNTDILSKGITLDLLILMPLTYLFFVRKSNLPNTSTILIFIIGLTVGSLILPEENQNLLYWFKTYALPLVEIGILSWILYKVFKTLKLFRSKQKNSYDFFNILKETCQDAFPNGVANFLAMEIAVIFYGFIFWKKRDLKENEFSYYKNSGTISLLFAFIFIIGIETYVLHILIVTWSVVAAWILSAISIYTGIQIFGFLKSIKKRPITIENNVLHLRYGIMSQVDIHIESITSIELSSKEIEQYQKTIKLSPLGALESHNIILHLNQELELTGFYGTKKSFKSIAFYADKKEQLKKCIDTYKEFSNASIES